MDKCAHDGRTEVVPSVRDSSAECVVACAIKLRSEYLAHLVQIAMCGTVRETACDSACAQKWHALYCIGKDPVRSVFGQVSTQ